MKQSVMQISLALVFGVCTLSAQASTLNSGARLTINAGVPTYDANYPNVIAGSWFAVDFDGNFAITGSEKTALSQGTTGIVIGSATAPGASHPGSPNPGDTNAITAPWSFLGNTGSDYTTAGITGGTSGLNMSGWKVTWNGIPSIPLGTGAWTPSNCATLGVPCTGFANGIGLFAWDGVYGHNYALNYSATVPHNDPSGFGDVHYFLHLEGSVQAVPVPAAAWLLGSGLAGLMGTARRRLS